MNKGNPYTLGFGRIPNEYISRDVLISDIIEALNNDMVDDQAFKLTGIRGTGKTVTLTAIERELRQEKEWIIVNLRFNADLLVDLVGILYSEVPFLTKFIDSNLNLTAFGIGVNISQKSPVASISVALRKLLKEIKKQKKKLLITIDEVQKTQPLLDFIQEFQILIREDYPIYFIAAGLYEDIEAIENEEGMTFFLRAAKYEMKPLNLNIIKESYKATLKLSDETATKLARLTKGYAFAFQVFGAFMWESGGKEITDLMLAKVDDALSEKVYSKIWSELAPADKWFLSFIIKKDSMPVSELLELTKKKHSDWSRPRKRLAEKGVIDKTLRGEVKIILPRFKEFVEAQI